MSEETFVQIGLRKNGRIVKNEQYSVKEFVDNLSIHGSFTPKIKWYKFSRFNWIFRMKEIQKTIDCHFGDLSGLIEMFIKPDIAKCIYDLIEKDNFGKKKSKR